MANFQAILNNIIGMWENLPLPVAVPPLNPIEMWRIIVPNEHPLPPIQTVVAPNGFENRVMEIPDLARFLIDDPIRRQHAVDERGINRAVYRFNRFDVNGIELNYQLLENTRIADEMEMANLFHNQNG